MLFHVTRSAFSSCKSSAFERFLGFLWVTVFSSLIRALHRGRVVDVKMQSKSVIWTHCTGSLCIWALYWASEHLFTFFLILISRLGEAAVQVCSLDNDGVWLCWLFRQWFLLGCRWIRCLHDADWIIYCCARGLQVRFVGHPSRRCIWSRTPRSLLDGLGNVVALGLRGFLNLLRLGRGVIWGNKFGFFSCVWGGSSISKTSLLPRLIFLTSWALLAKRFCSDLSIILLRLASSAWWDRLLRAWSKSSLISSWDSEPMTFLTCCVFFLLGTGCWGGKVLLSLLLYDCQERFTAWGNQYILLCDVNPIKPVIGALGWWW